jgi:hypothetical protein
MTALEIQPNDACHTEKEQNEIEAGAQSVMR